MKIKNAWPMLAMVLSIPFAAFAMPAQDEQANDIDSVVQADDAALNLDDGSADDWRGGRGFGGGRGGWGRGWGYGGFGGWGGFGWGGCGGWGGFYPWYYGGWGIGWPYFAGYPWIGLGIGGFGGGWGW